MADVKPYHHGDLRAKLLVAAAAELSEKGIDSFSLRQIAKRAGVSHAAPKHHFGNVQGILTALAVRGFADMMECIDQLIATLGSAATDTDRYFALSRGYLRFAEENSAQFDLMFKANLLDAVNAELMSARARLEDRFKNGVKSVAGHLDKLQQDRVAYLNCGTVYGLASLYANTSSSANDQKMTRDAFAEFENMLVRVLKS
jgi:AcrR family transcriptional regulator